MERDRVNKTRPLNARSARSSNAGSARHTDRNVTAHYEFFLPADSCPCLCYHRGCLDPTAATNCHVPGGRLVNYCARATSFPGSVEICSLFSPSRCLRPTMAGNPIKAWADDIGAPIGEEDAARVIGTSLHGRYDIGLPGFGARSTPRGRRLVAPCRWSSGINLRSWYFLPPHRVRGICFAARARYRGGCAAVSAPQDFDRTKFLLIVSDCAAVSAPSRRW